MGVLMSKKHNLKNRVNNWKAKYSKGIQNLSDSLKRAMNYSSKLLPKKNSANAEEG